MARTADTALLPAAEAEKPYVLVKRGLYWRPAAQGYTGVLAEAGRYTAEKAGAYTDGGQDRSVVAILASEAEEFSPACWEETKIRVYRDRLITAESALSAALARADRLENALLNVRRRLDEECAINPESQTHYDVRDALSDPAPAEET